MERGVTTGYLFRLFIFFIGTWYRELSIVSIRVIFYRSSCIHPFFQGLYGTESFWQKIPIKNSYLFRRSLAFGFFKGSLFISRLYLHPSIPWSSVAVFVTERMGVIHPRVLNLFWQDSLQSSIVWVIFSAAVCLFSKQVGSSYVFFQSYDNYFYTILAVTHPFNVMYISLKLKFATTQFCQLWAYTSRLEANFLSKQLYFQSGIN